MQRAFLSLSPVVIASTTDAAWNERLAADSVVRDNSHRMRVPEPTIDETVAILGVHGSRIESDYGLKIADNALTAAATLAKRYVAGATLPASALGTLHRAARCSSWRDNPGGLPSGPPARFRAGRVLQDRDQIPFVLLIPRKYAFHFFFHLSILLRQKRPPFFTRQPRIAPRSWSW